MVQLKGYKLNSVYFENKVAGNTKLALQNQVKYNVHYIEDESRCIGTLNFRVFDTDMQPFEIKIEAVAEFTYTADEEKSDIHIGSFDQLFPYVRKRVATLTSMSSMPSLILPIVRLERSSVEMQSNEKNNDEGMLN